MDFFKKIIDKRYIKQNSNYLDNIKINKVQEIYYLKDFKCLASKCKMICCGGWDIAIDKDSFFYLDNCLNEDIRKNPKILTLNEKNTQSNFYAKLNLRNCMCPFLNNDKLCSIQIKYGEMSIPIVCNTFPKVFNIINDVLVISARLSCPEISRLALLNKNATNIFNRNTLNDCYRKEIDVLAESSRTNLSVYYDQIQKYIFKILKNNNINLEERLHYLVILIKKFTQLNHEITLTDVKKIFTSVNVIMFNRHLNNFKKNIDFQYEFLMENIISEHIKALENSNPFGTPTTIYSILKEAQRIDESTYQFLLHTKFNFILTNFNYIFENFLVNWIINEKFPFKSNIMQYQILRLIVNYSLIRFLCISKFKNSDHIKDEEIISLICDYSRAFNNTELPRLKTSFSNNTNTVFDLIFTLI